ncbi:MAG: hypothetical protein E7360_03025 [Clostridiales bacterium]|nr:hypothetical protein [Clostridiales bacterium]
MEELNVKTVKAQKAVNVFKIISAVIYGLITLFLLITFFDTVFSNSENKGLSLAVYLAIILIAVGGIAYVVNMAVTLIGFIITAVNIKNGIKKSNLVYFLIFTVLPIFTEAILILICIIYKNSLP